MPTSDGHSRQLLHFYFASLYKNIKTQIYKQFVTSNKPIEYTICFSDSLLMIYFLLPLFAPFFLSYRCGKTQMAASDVVSCLAIAIDRHSDNCAVALPLAVNGQGALFFVFPARSS